ncbi:MAG: histidine phosphatase family protein [Rhodomicrobium sp.]
MATTIIVTRHGHVEGIDPPRFRGREDVSLTSLGVKQAKATAKRIAALWEPTIVYTSPMTRCVATGAAIAEACHAPAKIMPSLNDLDYGTWQWKTHQEVAKHFPDDYATWFHAPHLFRFPEGESLQDLVARAAEALRRVLQQHRDQTAVLVGHDSVDRALLTQVLDQPLSAYWRLHLEPCGISEIRFEGLEPRVLRLNETFHLINIA